MDARFPTHWLNDRRLLRLSPEQFRMFVIANAWSVTNMTDGIIETPDLQLVPFATEANAAALVGAGLWAVIPTGWYILSFEDAQTSSAQLEGLRQKKRQDADRAKAYRERKKASRDGTHDDHVTDGVTTKARKGKAKASLDDQQPKEAQVANWDAQVPDHLRTRPFAKEPAPASPPSESASVPECSVSEEAERIAREAAAVALGIGTVTAIEPAQLESP